MNNYEAKVERFHIAEFGASHSPTSHIYVFGFFGQPQTVIPVVKISRNERRDDSNLADTGELS